MASMVKFLNPPEHVSILMEKNHVLLMRAGAGLILMHYGIPDASAGAG